MALRRDATETGGQDADGVRARQRVAIVVGGALVLFCAGLMWGLPHLDDPAQDSLVPYGNLAQVGASFQDVTAHRYPPFHFYLLRTAFVVTRAMLPLAATQGVDQSKVTATAFILTARLISVIMAMGTTWIVYRIGRRLFSQSAALIGAAVFALSPVTLYYAKNANLDIPSVFWLAAALLMLTRVMQGDRPLDCLWLGLFAALAVCTKDQMYGAVALLPIPIAARLWRAKGWAGCARRMGIGAAGFVAAFVLIHNLLFDFSSFRMHIQTILGPASQIWRECAPGVTGQARLLLEAALRLMDAWTLAGVALAIAGVVIAWRGKTERGVLWALLLSAVSYHVTFLAAVGYVYPRFVLPMMVALAPFAGRAAEALWQRRRLWARAAAVGAVAWIGLAGAALDLCMVYSPRYAAQEWLESHADGATRIRYFGEIRTMPCFREPLDPRGMEASEEALRAADPPPELIVVSLEQGHPATHMACLRLASIIRRNLGAWGRISVGSPPDAFVARLIEGEFGYRVVVRFACPAARFIPEVSESVNRTFFVLARSHP